MLFAIASASRLLSEFVQSTYSDTKKEPFSSTEVRNSLSDACSEDLTNIWVTINTGSPEASNSTIDSFHRTPTLFQT